MDPDGSSLLFRSIPAQHRFSTEEKRALRAFIRDLWEHVTDGRTFTCLVTNDRELRKLNQDFLGRDYAADVLSFPAGGGVADLGELAISAERAALQAEHFGHSRLDEVRVLMLHGVLHLTGLDHETDNGRMARAERRWRSQFQLPGTLIARVSRPGLQQ